jgi:ATP-dependent RNA helicase RhlE
MRFSDLQLIDPLLQALEKEGYETPTPIQQQAIPHVLAERDLLGVAQTGTGKTAAFSLPILQLLSKRPARGGGRHPVRALILTPTRELAAQIGESLDRYGAKLGIVNSVIFGGVGQGAQVSALRKGVDILVATPGRLLDLMDQKFVDLSNLEIFVLDEADRMLDMGFIHDVRRVIKTLPRQRHSLFFSATMPPDIQRLAQDILTKPVKVEVTPVATTAEKIQQSVYYVEIHDKRRLLEHVMRDPAIRMALVFTRTKHGADKVAKYLNQVGVTAEAIHGNKSQNNRTRALNSFKEGQTRVLVATDIAARGIDIDGVTHVLNYELPNIPESYVHRIGRTARAGAEGTAISFCSVEERPYLKDIERLIRLTIRKEEGDYPGSENAGRAGAPAERGSKPLHMRPEPREPREGGGGNGRGGHAPRAAHGGGRGRPQSGGSRSGHPGGRPQGNGGRPQGGSGREGAKPGHRPGGPRPGQRPSGERSEHSPRGAHPQGRSQSRSQSLSRGGQGPRRSDERAAKPSAPQADKQPWWKKLIKKD